MQGFHLCAMGKQFIGVTRRLLVIERLSVVQRVARREDMNPTIHIYMDQTGQLEIPGQREDGCKPSPPGFVYAWYRCNLFRFGFHSLPFIVISKKDRSK